MPSRLSHASRPSLFSNELPKMSEVPCYTCRRRHIICDQALPHCAKCAKKGVPCLGYQKPLRWANGVAVRGRLKGKSKPVINGPAVRTVQRSAWTKNTSPLQEVAYFGLHATGHCCTDVAGNDASFLELITYHNERICAEHIGWEQSRFRIRKVSPLSHEVVQRLPRDIVKGILGNSAVHMAVRDPENRSAERLALETRNRLFQGLHRLLQSPQDERRDVLFCCIILLFAMDVMEHGTNRWYTHFSGAMNVIASFGGIESFATQYPHLRLILAQLSHFETIYLVLSHVPVTKPKQASRRAIEALCYDPYIRRAYYIPSAPRLTLAIYDVGVCARNVLGSTTYLTMADVHERDRILCDVLAFQSEEGIADLKETYFQQIEVTEERRIAWDLMAKAWKSAIILLVIRYLYFGLPNPAPQSHFRRPPTLSENASPEPPCSLHTSNLWRRRYELHDDAFSALSASFFALQGKLQCACMRYVLVPLFVLALISRPSSAERALCLSYFEEFKEGMVKGSDHTHSGARTISSPVGGQVLDFDIPWDKLDAYSEAMEQERQGCTMPGSSPLCRTSAPEWNWWHMLREVDLKFIWPVASGTMHLELGSEFWAFGVLSSVVTNECFEAWVQPLVSS